MNEKLSFKHSLSSASRDGYSSYFEFISSLLFISFIYYLLVELTSTLVDLLYVKFLNWHDLFPGNISNDVYIDGILRMITFSICISLFYFMYNNVYQSIICKNESYDLENRISSFGLNSRKA